MNVEGNPHNNERSITNALLKTAKITGAMVLSGVAGYAAAKGFENFVMPVDPVEVFDAAVVAASMGLGGFICSEVTA